jgi:hypothetical protein
MPRQETIINRKKTRASSPAIEKKTERASAGSSGATGHSGGVKGLASRAAMYSMAPAWQRAMSRERRGRERVGNPA